MRLSAVIITFLLTMAASGRPYYFRHYRIDDGLSNNAVMDCIQDKRGFVWFGTKEGLTRFDGYKFKVFLNNPEAANSLISNFITAIREDNDGWIWVGTPEGICYYIPESDYFGTISSEDQEINSLVADVEVDRNNNIWISTRSGLFKYRKDTGRTTFYSSEKFFIPGGITVTASGDVWFTAVDGMIYKYDELSDNFRGNRILSEIELAESVRLVNIIDAGQYGLIVATDIAGIRIFNPNNGTVSGFFEKDNLWNNIMIRTTCLFPENELWIGTESGIYIYNMTTGFVTNLYMVNTDPFSLSNNAVRKIVRDREGGVWVGTFYGGVNYLPQENKLFEKYYPTGLPGSLNGNVVREIRADSRGNIWIGTEDAGLIKMDKSTGIFTSIKHDRYNSSIDSKNIQGLLVDGNDLWIGTYDNGIYILDIQGQKIKRHFEFNDGRSGLRTNSIITFLKTTDGIILAGCVDGIYRYDRETESFKYLENVAAGSFIHVLFEDNSKTVWIGTYGRGLYRYNSNAELCKKIVSEKGDYEDLRFEYITSITQDREGRIWFTTEGNGFSYITRETEEVTRYIPGKQIDFSIYCAMLQDDEGNFWITSTRGLLRFNPVSNEYSTYTKNDGLPDNTFSYNSACRDENGKMYFGTVKGLLSFHPSNIRESSYNPPVYFTGLQVNGNEYFRNYSGSADNRSPLVTDKITLKHHQSSISIDFVSPTFTNPAKTRYKYIMEGSDPDWVVISGNRKVYYTNLAPGKYRFRVASSPDGRSWGTNEASLEIRITPPLWLSVPAYSVYLILTVLVIYQLLRFYMRKNALEHQRKLELFENEKERDILNAKINFFTNITHEVRTPLTLIKGPLDRILKSGLKNPKDIEENLLIIKRNTDRLLNLTNQLLDFRKAEKEMFRMNFVRTEMVGLIESVVNLFMPYSQEKKITVQMHSPVSQYYMAVDREAIMKIVSNLMSNAMRYADSKVDLYLETETDPENTLRIRVNSDGKLIPAGLKEKIFEPFYQIDFDRPGEKGTGLGLSLARSLAELHHGRLFLDINESKCNSFVLELAKNQEESVTSESADEFLGTGEQTEYETFGSYDNSRPLILLVEDETETGRFIAKELSEEYNVILVSNGAEALKVLKKHNIALVVSDVIMPVLNGYEFCRQVKSNIETSHIPVILLTATIHLNAKIEGLESGADAYIEKPFSTDLLLAQIANLIRNRKLNLENFINTPLAHFKTVAMNKTDEEFLRKLHVILMDNISETDLSVEKIADLMGISVSTLYRKVKALTDLNTVEYIRFARLKKSAELLSEGNYRINEISYLVGFSSPSYFATSFQKQFGMSPTQFIKRLR